MTDREFIRKLSDLYGENRSDVAELCDIFLVTGKLPKNYKNYVESRFIQGKIPNTEIQIEYDTLTTHISYHIPLKQWEIIEDVKYIDN